MLQILIALFIASCGTCPRTTTLWHVSTDSVTPRWKRCIRWITMNHVCTTHMPGFGSHILFSNPKTITQCRLVKSRDALKRIPKRFVSPLHPSLPRAERSHTTECRPGFAGFQSCRGWVGGLFVNPNSNFPSVRDHVRILQNPNIYL